MRSLFITGASGFVGKRLLARIPPDRYDQVIALPWSIVRPTIALGPGSPILDKLRTLAGGPVVAVIGNGLARVQPIDVEDLAGALAVLLERRTFDGATREIGGPEVLTMEKL